MERMLIELSAIGVAMYRREAAELAIKYLIKPMLRYGHKHLVKTEQDAAIWVHSLNKQVNKK